MSNDDLQSGHLWIFLNFSSYAHYIHKKWEHFSSQGSTIISKQMEHETSISLRSLFGASDLVSILTTTWYISWDLIDLHQCTLSSLCICLLLCIGLGGWKGRLETFLEVYNHSAPSTKTNKEFIKVGSIIFLLHPYLLLMKHFFALVVRYI